MEDEQQDKNIAERLRKHDAFCHIFQDTPQGQLILEVLREKFYFEYDPIHQPGTGHADLCVKLGQRTVIAYILEVLSITSDQIMGEEQQRKADETDE